MTELIHDANHPWTTANMIDARSHQSDRSAYDSSYRTPSTHSRREHSSNRSQSRINAAPSPSPRDRADSPSHARPASPRLGPSDSQAPAVDSTDQDEQRRDSSTSPPRIRVKDLQHIQDIAGSDGMLSPAPSEAESDELQAPQYVISDMPVGDIIEMVAGLLTKITTANDQHHDHLHRGIPAPESAALNPRTSSVLAFHGKNVPSITILSYLSRIQKYCPATYEVFLSLLVYFDRMTERVNAGQMQSLRQANQESIDRARGRGSRGRVDPVVASTPPSSNPISPQVQRPNPAEPPSPPLSDSDPANLAHFFVVDSFNVHRLVIAGVTCAAKFFSDVFFTNSRYAKVGGLPLVELNHLELQFLLLNDFRLAVPVEELDQYATMLVEFYAREVIAQRQAEHMDGVDMVTR